MPRSLSDDLLVRLMEWRKRAARSAAKGAELVYLPPYSPDLNPIEQIFARLKVLLRKSTGRTVSILWAAIGTLLESFQPDECTNDFRHAAYDSN